MTDKPWDEHGWFQDTESSGPISGMDPGVFDPMADPGPDLYPHPSVVDDWLAGSLEKAKTDDWEKRRDDLETAKIEGALKELRKKDTKTVSYDSYKADWERGTNPKDLIGAKKVNPAVVPPIAVAYTALAMANGANKYGPFNWRSNKVIATIYYAAAIRHLNAWFDGEEIAKDSGVPHLAHAMACLAILVDAKETGNLIDDRPIPGASAIFMEEWNAKMPGLLERWESQKKK